MDEIWRCLDCQGREIVLPGKIWREKILPVRSLLIDHEQLVQATVQSPTLINQDVDDVVRECFYRQGVLPGYPDRYLKVVVVFEPIGSDGTLIGRVITVYPTDRVKQRESLLWSPP